MTDNRNRTASEVRKLFEVHGGKLGATGCVAYLFDRKGLILVPNDKTDEDALMEVALETGADDIRSEGENFVVTCEVDVYSDVCEALEQASIETSVKQVTRIPNSMVDLNVDVGRKVIKLMEALDDHDDVQNVAANFNLPEEAMAELAGD